MGKTSRHDTPRDTKKNKKDIESYLPFSDDIEINDEDDQEYKKEESELYINETATIIRQKILDYVDAGTYSLCEYLDIENVENYLLWLLDKS